MALALDGIKVVDVSQVVAVPIAARHLADFGAEVIHIEHPQRGDSWRGHQAGQGGTNGVPSDINYNWETFNRNKKSLAIDLSQERGREIIYKLLQKTDVFVTNLRLWEREKFGLEYDTLSRLNPRLIYGSITGYGKKGPDRNAPAYDQTAAWFRAGITHVLTPRGVPAIGFRAGFIDTVAGMSLFAGVMTALYARERSGIGQEVELSLFNTGIYQLSFDVSGALATGRDFKDMTLRGPDEEAPTVKRYRELVAESEASFERVQEFIKENVPNPLAIAYKTKDERIIHINVLHPDRYWAKICQAIDRPDLEHDPRFESHEIRLENHRDLYYIMKEAFESRTLEELKPRLAEAGIPFAPQQKLSEVINDPQARANDYFVPFDHPTYGRMEVMANPINLSKTPSSIRLPAPEFSQHTEEIILRLGYAWEDIDQFKQQGIIP